MNWKLVVIIETIIVVGLILAWFFYPVPAAEAPRVDTPQDPEQATVTPPREAEEVTDGGLAVEPVPLAQTLRSTMWYWQETVSGEEVVRPRKAEVFTIQFASDGRVNGTTDCNSFSGTYTLSGSVLTIGPLGMTKMFCPEAQEGEFVGFLAPNPLTVSVTDDGAVQLFAQNGEAVMRLAPR